MPLSEGDKAIVAAIEILRRDIAPSALAQAMNAAGTGGQNTASGNENLGQAPRRAGSTMDRGVRRAADAAAVLALSFGRLLTPLAVFGTFLSQSTSGFSLFSKALNLLAASVAPVLMPVFFSLAVGLAAASEVIFKKLLPSLEAFDRYVLSTAIPAMAQFVETVGHATTALVKLANSPLGKAAGAAMGEGDIYGTVNRTLGRLGLAGEDPDKDKGTIASIEGGLDDVARMIPGLGPGFVGAKNWAKRQVGFGGDEAPASTVSGDTAGAMGRARSDTLRELMLSMGPKASSGSVGSVWSRAQMAGMNQSPFERRMLEMMMKVVTTMARAEARPGAGTFTEDVRGVVHGAMADILAGAAAGRRR